MKANVQKMQGVSAYIETHYEAMAYYHQEKKICHYRQYGDCSNQKSIQCNKRCIGYTKCPDFISDAKYMERLGNAHKTVVKKKQNKGQKKPKPVKKSVDSKVAMKKKKNKVVKKELSDNALGNDPKLKAIFEQFKSK